MPYYRLTSLSCIASFLFIFSAFPAFANRAASSATTAASDTAYKNWYFTPTAVYGRLPLEKTKYRSFVRVSHSSPGLAVVESYNPAGIVVNTTRLYFTDGLISLTTETDRWGYTYDSTWYRPDGPDKLLVTERKKGVNPFLPCKYLEYTFKNGLLTDILCFRDSIRAGDDQAGVAHYVFERYTDPDRRGLIRSETFLSNIDAPTFSRTADCHKVVNDFDPKGNLLSRSIYGLDDKPVLDRYGVFRTRYKYDGDDNETEADYFDTGDQLTVTAWGYAERVRDYKHGFIEEETHYFDRTTVVRGTRLADSAAIIQHKYDQDGDETETAYFGPEWVPIDNSEGVQKIQNEYSTSGMLIQTNRISLNQTSGWDSKLYFTGSFEHNDKGLLTAIRFHTNTGIVLSDFQYGGFVRKISYDAWGRIHTIGCWQDDNTRMACTLGYQEIVNRYNDDGQLVEVDYNDSSGNPYAGVTGFSKELMRYNEQGFSSDLSFFSGDKPVVLRLDLATISNFHRMQYNYDGLNRLRSIKFYDAADHPVNAVFRPGKKTKLTAGQIDLDYNGALLISELLQDSGDLHAPVTLDCAKGQCLPATFFASIGIANPASVRVTHSYHGAFRPDSLFDRQLGFIGRDTILVFMDKTSGYQTGVNCGELYRVAPINKYYQLDGRVTDYYMETDSVEASFNYEHGTLEGPASIYYPNGQVKEKGVYHENVRSARWDYFYDNGQKEKSIQFEGGQPYLVDCYTRTGQMLASGGNGLFVGTITTNTLRNPMEMEVRGNVKNGLPDGEWELSNAGVFHISPNEKLRLSNIEKFSDGKLVRGTFVSLSGRSTYHDKVFSRVESLHPYESVDHYRQNIFCRPEGPGTIASLYPEIRQGFLNILGTNKYGDYSGWVFLDVHIDATGHVASSYVRLYQPNDAFEKDIREMASRLVYPSSFKNSQPNYSFDRLYILLVEANHVVIPEEVLESQQDIFRR